jgi:cytochrome c oxidase assembly protein subunit 15
MTKHRNSIVLWLISGCVLIGLMVIIGGITRLTHSGLSMVEWKPITGIIPPLNESDWMLEFEKYQKSPEFIHLHNYFSLEDFKKIFFWEYLHRLIGRIIGIVFIIPFCYFYFKNHLTKQLKKRVLVIFSLGFFQGFLGWFMVKSGLVDNPNVSHYRLAAHFTTALFLIIYIYYTVLEYKYGKRIGFSTKILAKPLLIIFCLLTIQITYGAFVSGLKAGFMYNTYPKMGEDWIPESMNIAFQNEGFISLLENKVVVQFMHRIIPLFILSLIVYLYLKIKQSAVEKLKKIFTFFIFAILLQITFGILTLIYQVPLSLGVIHQAMAIVLLLLFTKVYYLAKKTL